MLIRILTTLLFVLTLIACDKKEDAPKAAHDPAHKEAAHDPTHKEEGHEHAEAKGGHAPAGAALGSHEDWCGGHGVAESQCTRCNPSLIAGFKATKDWCEEHKLPKSQCIACNPDLVIKRPAKTAK